MNIFIRIKDNGYDINGNHLNRVFTYINSEGNNQFFIIDDDTLNKIKIGRKNKDNSITTQRTKEEIINRFNIVFKSDNVFYVFE